MTPSLSAFRERVHPEDQARLEDVREKESKAEAGTQFQIELRLVRPDGNLCWIDRRSRVIEHEGRRRIIGVNVDITGRKKQEDNLHFIMDELSHRTKNYSRWCRRWRRRRRAIAETTRTSRRASWAASGRCRNRTICW